ncbi:serine/threonine protein kinase [Nitzschia inconspicua]|uniref:Serine/threonine protein kinase n=1 Tax=Nitzschia inconspicua TaxID=303405 RepID=A0A9K3M1N5_9STRA|nr:serine/threonine protein kinase [Nitzschia inconspicua]
MAAQGRAQPPVDEGDFEQLANVVEGIANAVVPVLSPIESLIEMRVVSLAPPDSKPAILADWVAEHCNLCQIDTAIHFRAFNIHTDIDGFTVVLTLDLTSQLGAEQASDFFLHICSRMDPFFSNTNYSILAFGDNHPIVDLICERLLVLGANEVIPSHYIVSDPDEVALFRAVTVWRDLFGAQVIHLWEQMAIPQRVFIAQAQNPQVVYQIFTKDEFVPVELRANGVVRGHLFQGYALRRYGSVFLAPSEDEVEIVAIKRLFTGIARRLLEVGHQENPWREVYRLQTLGDDVHVPRLMGGHALDDGQHLFIITRFANEGSLDQHLKSPRPFETVKDWFDQMVEILRYLEEHNISHRDIKPANILVHDGRLLLTDFAMSFVIPMGGIVLHPHVFGTPAFMPPEHFLGGAYVALQYDLWSIGCCWLCLLTGLPYIYECPSRESFLYSYVLDAGLLSTNPHNANAVAFEGWIVDRILEAVAELDMVALLTWEEIHDDMVVYRDRIERLPHDVLELFENLLALDPQTRWNTLHVMAWLAR